MKVIDPGYTYLLDSIDGGEPVPLTFVKRDSPPEKYPGNVGHYPGTQIQEVLRALVERGTYLQGQFPCPETETLVNLMRTGICLLETRTRRVRGQPGLDVPVLGIESAPTCEDCGHIGCLDHPVGDGGKAL